MAGRSVCVIGVRSWDKTIVLATQGPLKVGDVLTIERGRVLDDSGWPSVFGKKVIITDHHATIGWRGMSLPVYFLSQ